MTLKTKHSVLATAVCFVLSARIVRADWAGPGSGPPWGGDDNSSEHCGWWGGDCNGSGSGSNSNGNNGNPAQLGFSASDLSHYNKVITIHAALACLVWVFLIPVGGILIRAGLKSPWILRIHALLQSISFLIYIVAVGCGVYLVRTLSFGQYSMWQDPHIKLGLAILVLAFLQPVLGLVHHILYKRRVSAAKAGTTGKQPGRTAPGYAHLWLGRVLIILGMINGGLGLRLAGSSRYETSAQAKTIAYALSATTMGLIYFAFVIVGGRRRVTERGNQDRGAIPLTAPSQGAPARYTYHHPPSYEASQENITKEAQTTARYS